MRVSTPWRKVLRDLWADKTRTLLAVLSIAVGIFGVGSVAGAFSLLHADIQRGYVAINPADATINVWPGFDQDLVASVRHVPGIAAVQAAGTLVVRVRTSDDAWINLSLRAIDDLTRMRVNLVRPDHGAWPADDRELLLERSSQARLNLPVDQPLEVELADGRRRALRLAGIIHDAGNPPALLSNEFGGFVTFDTLEWLGGERRYNRLDVTVTGASTEAQIRTVMDTVAERISRSGRSSLVIIRTPGEAPMQPNVDAMEIILLILALLLVMLSMVLIINTIAALMLQQRRQIGVMKAIGATTRQIVGMYLVFAFGLGLLAFLLASPLSALTAYAMAGLLARLLNTDPGGFALVPPVIVLQALIALATPALAALVPVLNGAQISVREAISAASPSSFGSGWAERLLAKVRFLSRPLLLALRNTVRRKGRLTLTLLTLTLAGAIFIGVGSAQAAFAHQLDELMSYFSEDVRISFARPYRVEQLEQIMLGVQGIDHIERWANRTAQRVRPAGDKGDALQLLAPEAASALQQPRILRGRWLRAEDQNALVVETRFMDNEPDVVLGSQVTLLINGHESAWVVVGVVPQLGNGAPLIYTSYEALARSEHNAGRVDVLRIVTTTHEPTAQRALANQLTAQLKERGFRVWQSQTGAEYRASVERLFSMIVYLLMIMALLVAFVGGLGLMGTMSMNVVERTREVGVLRAIGASDGAIQQIIVAEGLLIGLLSWLLALPAGALIAWVLSVGVGKAFLNHPLPYAYAPESTLAWLGLTLILVALASLLPAWRATRLTVREVLTYE